MRPFTPQFFGGNFVRSFVVGGVIGHVETMGSGWSSGRCCFLCPHRGLARFRGLCGLVFVAASASETGAEQTCSHCRRSCKGKDGASEAGTSLWHKGTR
jgi:hypothetical protein